MHVILLGPHPPPEGGINRNTLAIREELRAAGHRCSIIATSKSTRVVTELDVYHPSGPLDFLRLLRTINCDILHLHIGGDITGRVMALAFLSATFGRGRKILSFHSGGYPSTDEAKTARPASLRGRVFRMFERIIAVNPLIAEVFERYGIEKNNVDVIYSFVHRLPDPSAALRAELREFIDSHNPLLATVGLLENEYDLFMQIDAFEDIISEHPNAGLIIIGSGSLAESLRSAIAGKTYAENILLAGDVEHAQTLHVINRTDALWRTTVYDGDAISVREALFLGTPVVATDNGMRPDGVDLIPIGDGEELVYKTLSVLSAKRERTTPIKDDKLNIEAVLRVYEEVLAS